MSIMMAAGAMGPAGAFSRPSTAAGLPPSAAALQQAAAAATIAQAQGKPAALAPIPGGSPPAGQDKDNPHVIWQAEMERAYDNLIEIIIPCLGDIPGIEGLRR